MNDPINGRLTDRRLTELERDVGRLQERTEQLPVLIQRIGALETSVRDMRQEMKDQAEKQAADNKSLRNTLITFALTVAGSAIAVLLGITQVLP